MAPMVTSIARVVAIEPRIAPLRTALELLFLVAQVDTHTLSRSRFIHDPMAAFPATNRLSRFDGVGSATICGKEIATILERDH
jgi:hypothetical protein